MTRSPESSTLPAATDVLIVGAGPTGLTLACVLARRGVPSVLVDRLERGADTSRAAVVHARTLEALEALDVTRRLQARGHVVPRFTVRDRDRVLAHIRFEGLPTRHPYTLMLPQQHTEAILLERLRELGGDVHRPHLVEQVAQDADGATVTLAGPAGRREVRARYVVGADGMHSVVRDQAGIAFDGDAYEHGFLLADVRMQWPLGRDEVILFFSPEGLVVVAPLPEGRHRVVATADRAPERPARGDVQALLDARGPRQGVRVDEVLWSSRFRVHHRLAERYRAGRILLAGDAAHVHSPAGGQGMNTGIQDAFALGAALADVVAGGAGVERLDRYESARRPVAQRVVAFTDRMTRMATLRDRRARAMRNALLSAVARIPAAPRRLAMELAGLRVPAIA